jgi:hypothetical protein
LSVNYEESHQLVQRRLPMAKWNRTHAEWLSSMPVRNADQVVTSISILQEPNQSRARRVHTR